MEEWLEHLKLEVEEFLANASKEEIMETLKRAGYKEECPHCADLEKRLAVAVELLKQTFHATFNANEFYDEVIIKTASDRIPNYFKEEAIIIKKLCDDTQTFLSTTPATEYVAVRREDLDMILNTWDYDQSQWSKGKLEEWEESFNRLKAALDQNLNP